MIVIKFLLLLSIFGDVILSFPNIEVDIHKLLKCCESILGENTTSIEIGCDAESLHISLGENTPEIQPGQVDELKKCLRDYAGNKTVSFSTYQSDAENLFAIILYNEPYGTTFRQFLSRFRGALSDVKREDVEHGVIDGEVVQNVRVNTSGNIKQRIWSVQLDHLRKALQR